MTDRPPGATDDEDDPVESSRMTLAEHLDELRSRLMKATIAFALSFIVLWVVREPVVQFIRLPFEQAMSWLNEDLVELFRERVAEGEPASKYFEAGSEVVVQELRISKELNFFGVGSNFLLRLRTCFWLSLFVAGPIALYQLWAFIAAGLYRSEKKVVYSYFPASLLLFVAGVAFGFFVMVPYAIYFLQKEGLGQPGYSFTISTDQYLQFLKGLALAVGIVFQMPVIQFALARLGIVDPKAYSKYRGHMIIGTLLVAAIITPPDPVTQMLLAVPAVILYEVGAAIARLGWQPVPGYVEPEASDG